MCGFLDGESISEELNSLTALFNNVSFMNLEIDRKNRFTISKVMWLTFRETSAMVLTV